MVSFRPSNKVPNSRSDAYQHLYHEILLSADDMRNWSNGKTINSLLDPFAYDERLLDLKDQLIARVKSLIVANLTPHQLEVLTMLIDGYTQMDIAKRLGVNQSCITKCINGNISYANDKNKQKETKYYGGIFKKLKRVAAEDEQIKAILAEINELQEEKL